MSVPVIMIFKFPDSDGLPAGGPARTQGRFQVSLKPSLSLSSRARPGPEPGDSEPEPLLRPPLGLRAPGPAPWRPRHCGRGRSRGTTGRPPGR
jgi:hypothetical protein